MSMAPHRTPVEVPNSHDRDADNGLIRATGDQEDSRCFLRGSDAYTPTVVPPAMNASYPSLPRSPATTPPPLSPIHINPVHLAKSLLAHPDNQKDEESGAERRKGEEETKKKVKPHSSRVPRRIRDLAAYWLLGFCNNFTYWVMITAAYDLLAAQHQGYSERSALAAPSGQPLNASLEVTVSLPGWSNDSFVNTFTCNRHSTGAILVADTLPATALTLAAPLTLLLSVGLRVWVLSIFCIVSYLVLGLASPDLVFLGVALASASRGLSDPTFLSHATNYHKNVLSLWSSGTGVATFVGPLLFSAMTTWGLHPRHALLTFLAVPVVIVFSFWCLLSRAQPLKAPVDLEKVDSVALVCEKEEIEGKKQKMAARIKQKIFIFGLEMVYFPASPLTHAQQYSWSITIRCLGTLISRSSHKLFLLPSTWLYSLIALVIAAVVGTEAHFHYLPSEYIIFALMFMQGLSEGASFRAAVFSLHNKTSEEDREFSMAIFPAFLFLPAMLAGFASIPTHEFLCHHHLYRQ
ncbi:battenin-like isoform X2 [Scylla paramamosain]|uniref:battenin-like isoform X2 n=1 Tax=Scylla paramamosain TaxID=85552 RepID=UPI003083C3AE